MGPSAAPEKPPGVRDRMLPSSLPGGIHKVNRRQAREGTLGYSVSRKGLSAI